MTSVSYVIKNIKTGLYWKNGSKKWVQDIMQAKHYFQKVRAMRILDDYSCYVGEDHIMEYRKFRKAYPSARIFRVITETKETMIEY